MKRFLSWLKYRKLRKEQAARAASLAVQLVMSGSLAPPKFSGIGAITSHNIYSNVVVAATSPSYLVVIGREGTA